MLSHTKSYKRVTFLFIVKSAQKTQKNRFDNLCKNYYNADSLRNTKGRAACVWKTQALKRKFSAGKVLWAQYGLLKYKARLPQFSTANIMAQVH